MQMLCLERKKQEVNETEIKRHTAPDSTEIKLLLLDSLFHLQQPLEPVICHFLPDLSSSHHEKRALTLVLCSSMKPFGLTKVSFEEKKPPERKELLQLLLSQFLFILCFHTSQISMSRKGTSFLPQHLHF